MPSRASKKPNKADKAAKSPAGKALPGKAPAKKQPAAAKRPAGKAPAAKKTATATGGKRPAPTKSSGTRNASSKVAVENGDGELRREQLKKQQDHQERDLQIAAGHKKAMLSKTEMLLRGERPKLRKTHKSAAAAASGDAAASKDVEDMEGEEGEEEGSQFHVVRYDPKKYTKIYNVLGGQSGEGMCYRNGVVRKQGKAFMKKLRDLSDSFLLELVKKMYHYAKGANSRKTITLQDVLCASKTMGIHSLSIGK